MLLSEVSIGEKFKKIFMSSGIVALYPPQELIVKSKVFSGKNGLLVTPTASGKTFAAELLMAKHLEMGGKIVYVTPLKALAYEKYLEFKKYENLGYKVALEIGDLDASNLPRTLSFDILVVTAEKCDSMLRSRARLFDGVSLLIVDEIHLLATDRGPVYEIIITKFRKLLKDLQILGLSATIGNPEEIANWLDAELIISEWRPVPLKEEVIVAKDKFKKTISIVENTLNDGGQVLIFTTSRKSCESLAEKIANTLNLSSGLEKELKEISASILEAVNTPTEQCKKLASCVAKGVGFHHAGITNAQRMIIEDSFKDGSLKVIVSTPTLAAGVNLPSRVVIIYSLKRYDNFSSRYIAVMEYKQQAGRAGRPRYDNFGISYVLASSNSEKDFIMEKYINGKPESIFSRLGVEPVLRFHVLALIATSHLLKMDSILDFFKETFFGYQYSASNLKPLLEKITAKLIDWSFVREEKGFLMPTPLGERVSQLYIDPMTAHIYVSLLEVAEATNNFNDLGLLEMLCSASEMPLLRVSRNEERRLWEEAMLYSENFLRDISGFDLDFNFLERYKTAKLLFDWINEASEDKIYEAFSVPPGMLYQRVSIAEWLSYSASEIAKILKLRKSQKKMKKLEYRLRYGIKDELLELVTIKGIGRARARKLFDKGIKTINDLKKLSEAELSKILGKKTAKKIKEII